MHQPVLLEEVVELLKPAAGGIYLDGTVGGGGHAAAILKRTGPTGKLIGLDCDDEAIARAGERLAEFGPQVRLIHGRYEDMEELATGAGVKQLDGVLLDMGVSSQQLDTPERGFSFMKDGPLDMRMDRSSGRTAADLVNGLPVEELERVFRDFGEERMARRIAGAVVTARNTEPFARTGRLAAVVEDSVGGRRSGIHPATRVFQALRIVVNGELDGAERGVEAGLRLLATGGRMAVITFHSLEDRLVKHCFSRHAGRWESLQQGGRRWVGERPVVRLVTRHVVTPSRAEQEINPRCRSAKLRVVERIEGQE